MLRCIEEGRLLKRSKSEESDMIINILLCDDDKTFLQRLADVITSQPLPRGISANVIKSCFHNRTATVAIPNHVFRYRL